jgi:hypothetical protein
MRRTRWYVFGFAAVILVCVSPSAARAVDDGEAPGGLARGRDSLLTGYNPEHIFGPTNVNAVTGNGGLSVGVSRDGDITVLRWPTPSMFDQVDYLAVDFDAPRMGASKVEGVFSGLLVDGALTWFREAPWTSTQGYLSDEDSVIVTAFANEALGLVVEQLDFVLPDDDVLVRLYEVTSTREPDADLALVFYENLEPCNERTPLSPTRDWLMDWRNDGKVEFDPDNEVLHHFRDGGPDIMPIHFAIAADRAVADFQCGYEGLRVGGGECALRDLADGTLRRNAGMKGHVNAALVVPLTFIGGHASAAVYLAAADDENEARATLAQARATPALEWLARTHEWWADWIGQATLPAMDDPEVRRTIKRLLMSIRVGTNRESGMMVASIASQPPYYLDWPRDGAAIGNAMDRAGYTDMVTVHNLYYASIQRPGGSYWMNYYPDGKPGGPLPIEIDADGIVTWALWDHAAYLNEPARTAYLEAVYPAIRRSAEFLCDWRDPETGLPLPSFELDSILPRTTLVGAAAVYAGLKAALAAGAEMGESPATLAQWEERRVELEAAIYANWYIPGQGFTDGGYGGAYLIWPAELRPPDDPEIVALVDGMYDYIEAVIRREVTAGSYNGVAMFAIAHVYAEDPEAHRAQMDAAADTFFADLPTPHTRHYGEGWALVDHGSGPEFENHVAMPHLLSGAYHLIAAYKFYGTE